MRIELDWDHERLLQVRAALQGYLDRLSRTNPTRTELEAALADLRQVHQAAVRAAADAPGFPCKCGNEFASAEKLAMHLGRVEVFGTARYHGEVAA